MIDLLSGLTGLSGPAQLRNVDTAVAMVVKPSEPRSVLLLLIRVTLDDDSMAKA